MAGKTNETTRDIVQAKLFGRGAAAHVYVECLVRTMTTDGLVMVTFTPLEGMSDVVMSFLEGGALPKQVREREGPSASLGAGA